jgi:ribosomal protein S18 acetylase RimI-like enzyme
MPDILADFSQASMARAVEANLFAFFEQLGEWPRVELHDEARCLWTQSDLPFPLFNSVARARLSDGEADADIDARIRQCGDRRVPMLWWTGPSTTPADLGERLERRGFIMEPAFGMAAALDTLAIEPGADSDLSVETVDDAGALAIWSRVLCDAFSAPQSFGEAFADLAAAMGLDVTSPFRHFLGRVQGEPAATCSVFFGAGVAGIYDVATLPQRRRRGLGAAVTRAAAAEALARGYRMAILHSSTAGAAMYRALGFDEVCLIGQHVWAPIDFRR